MKNDPKEGPVKRIEQVAFRFHPQVTPHLQSNNACVLRRADVGRYTTIPAADWTVLSLLDGIKTIGDLIRERLEQGRGFGLLALLNRIADLRIKGFIIPELEAIQPDRKFGRWVLGFRLPLPQKVSGTKQAWPWAVGLLLSCIVAVGLLVTETFPDGAMRGATMLLAIWGSVAIVLSLYSILALIVLAQAGTWPWRIGVALQMGVPFFFMDSRDVRVAGPKAPIALALSELSSVPIALAMALGAYQRGLISPAFISGAIVGTIVIFWWMFRPFGGSPFIGLIEALTGKVSIGQDARAYFIRRLWRRTSERTPPLPSEPIFIVLALLYLLWGYIGFILFRQALTKSLFSSLYTILRESGESSLGVSILLGTLLTGIAVAIGGGLLYILRWLFQTWQAKRSKNIGSPRSHEVETLAEILAAIPFFAMIPQETLRVIASHSSLIDLPPRAYAVRQETTGDQFFIIREGKMAVVRRYESGLEERVAELLPGDTFGEMALLRDSVRTASVLALERTQVIAISRDAFEQAIDVSSLKREEVTLWIRLSQQLRHIPLFSEMTAHEVAYFLKRSQRRPVPSGAVLIHEGAVGSHFYIVLSGKFDVSRKGNPIESLGTGDFVGEIALLSSASRTTTVTAVEHSQVLEISRDAFFETLSLNFAFGAKIIETAQRRREEMG
ncbi:MAG: cyclic nucleotide-binding domain-containing protein [Nitrospirae bacterium]|nr:cyclic nucleotide-binding domain-containing protein [Candidatus Troglogloeales bacterium]MBI3598231.1 cyclic nucleotide-binding domain-containing protein [Candidatus Troglogloeales bacterium]